MAEKDTVRNLKIAVIMLGTLSFLLLLGYVIQVSRYNDLQQEINNFIITLNITSLKNAQEKVSLSLSQQLNGSVTINQAQYVDGLYAFNLTFNNSYYTVYSTIDAKYLLVPFRDNSGMLYLQVFPM